MAMRTTITLDDTLHAKLKQLTGARGMNQFISEALWEKIQQLEQEKIHSLMKEGYLATQSDRTELNADWQVVDVEGWRA
jgi:metal-responsive CopG/Arc/MetJ family transcriptional regulator